MRSLLLLFSLRLKRTWNAPLLLVGVLVLVAMTYLKPELSSQTVFWCLYVAALIPLLLIGQLQQLRRMPFARVLPRARRAELGILILAGVLTVAAVTLWMVSLPRPLPAGPAFTLGVLGFGIGMNPFALLAALALTVFTLNPAVGMLLQHPLPSFAVSLLINALLIPFAARGIGLWGHRDYRSEGLLAWRGLLTAMTLRRPRYTQAESGRSGATLARALVYEDAQAGWMSRTLRQWWGLPALMALLLPLWLLGVFFDLQEYAWSVMVSAGLCCYFASKFMAIQPRRGHLYPVSRRTLLQACWLAQLRRMLGLWTTWGGTLLLFCAVIRWIRPDSLSGMAWYYPLLSTAIVVSLPLPLAQGFAVHYGDGLAGQFNAADFRLGRSLVFLVNEVLVGGICLLLVLNSIYHWPPLKTVTVVLLMQIPMQGLLYLSMRRDLLSRDRA